MSGKLKQHSPATTRKVNAWKRPSRWRDTIEFLKSRGPASTIAIGAASVRGEPITSQVAVDKAGREVVSYLLKRGLIKAISNDLYSLTLLAYDEVK